MKQHIFTELLYVLHYAGAVGNTKEAIISLLLRTLWFHLKDKADTFKTIRCCLLKSVLQNAHAHGGGRATLERVLWSI